MSSKQRKDDIKLTTLQKSLVKKIVAGALNIFTEIQKEKFEIQTIGQMAADITAIVGKVSYDILLKRREQIKCSLNPEFRTLYSANNEPTELLFGNDLTKHVKDLAFRNKLKRSESHFQSKYSNNRRIAEHIQDWQKLSHQIKLYCRCLEEILLNLKKIFPQDIMQKIPIFLQERVRNPGYLGRNVT